MSSVGKPYRQLYYEINNYPKEKLSGKTLIKFLYGDLTENLIVALLEASGYIIEDFQQQIEVSGIKGHIDFVLVDGEKRYLIDVKSCSAYSFQKFKNGTVFEDDTWGYVAQLSGYAHAKKLPAAWIAFDKQSGEICVLELPQSRIDEYDIVKRIDVVKEMILKPEPPERCYEDEPDQKSGNRKLCVACSYCSYKFICWPEVKIYLYSTGPKYLTKIVREPKVFSVNKESN